MYSIGWFSTGRGQGSLNLLQAMAGAIHDGSVPAEIGFVFCSREPGDAEGSDRYIQEARGLGLPVVCFSSRRFKPELRAAGKTDPDSMHQWRIEYDREVMRRLPDCGAQLCVLAGYMLITGEELCRALDMINLHPAAPDGPAGTWQEVIWQLIEQRARQSGNMMHLVTEELDKGPPITYSLFPLRGPDFDLLWQEFEKQCAREGLAGIIEREGEVNPLFRKIRSEGARREIPLVLQTVNAFATGQVRLEDRSIVASGAPLEGPYCLTEAIETVL